MPSMSQMTDLRKVSTGYSPQEFNFTGFWDVVAASYRNQDENMNLDAAFEYTAQGRGDSYDMLADIEPDIFGYSEKEGYRKDTNFVDNYIKKKRKEGDARYNAIKTTSEIRAEIPESMRAAKQNFDEVYGKAAPDVKKDLASFVGAFPAAVTDLPNLLTLGFGAGAANSIFKVVAIEASLNAGIELAQQPFIYKIQNELGHNYTVDDVISSVGYAAAFGALFPVAIKSSVGVAKMTAKVYNKLVPSQKTAIAMMQREATMRDANPKVRTPETEAATAKNVSKVAEVMELEFRIPRPDELDSTAIPSRLTDEPGQLHTKVSQANEGLSAKDAEMNTKAAFVDEAIDDLSDTAKGLKPESTVKRLNDDIKKIKDDLEVIRSRKADADEQTLPVLKELEAAKLKEYAQKRSALDRHESAVKAVEDLDALRKGEIPESMQPKYKQFKKNVKAASKLQDSPNRIRMADEPPVDDGKVVEKVKSGEMQAAVEKEVQRILVDDPNALHIREDGTAVRLDELLQELDEEARVAKVIKGCAL